MAYAKEATRQLNMFVASPYFVDVCGAYASAELLAWLANSFFLHSDSLYFCHRKVCISGSTTPYVNHRPFANPSLKFCITQHLRCFDEYVNSVVEGQNSAAKTTNTGTKATYALDASVRCLNFRAHIKVALFQFVVTLVL